MFASGKAFVPFVKASLSGSGAAKAGKADGGDGGSDGDCRSR